MTPFEIAVENRKRIQHMVDLASEGMSHQKLNIIRGHFKDLYVLTSIDELQQLLGALSKCQAPSKITMTIHGVEMLAILDIIVKYHEAVARG